MIMKKSTKEIEVEVVGDQVHITQPDPMQNEDHYVVISKDQIVLLIEWLRQARDKIENNEV